MSINVTQSTTRNTGVVFNDNLGHIRVIFYES